MTEATAPAREKPLKVAIVGTAPTSRMMAPFADPAWDIWACSAGNMNALPRVNIWFEMHAIIEMMAPKSRAMAEPFYAWLKEKSDNGTFNVVMLELNPYVPKALPYPRDEMIALFGRNWFTSSVAYMMAVAIARGASEIALFGIDMAATQEHYEAQRAGCTRFIEIAEERGIKVHIPFESSLKNAVPMYGYWEGTPFGRRVNAVTEQVQDTLTALNAQLAATQRQMDHFAGALEQLRYFQRTWTDGAEMPLELGNLPELVEKLKAAGAPAEKLDEIMSRDDAPQRADIVVDTASPTAPPVTGFTMAASTALPMNTSTAFDALLQPARSNGALIEQEPHTETMLS